MFKLQNKIELIVPQYNNEGTPIEEVKLNFLDYALEGITQKVGGCTVQNVEGHWYSDKEQRVMIDQNKVYEWYYTEADRLPHYLRVAIRDLIKGLGQEAVSLKVNSNLYLVFPEDLENLSEELKQIL